MGSFLSQPVKVVCRDLEEVRAFLSTCRYVSDQEQFGVRDHWMSPQAFEQARQGDCDDFALWTCRQLLALGYNARFVVGSAGRYGECHAWVSFRDQDKIFILESVAPGRRTFPRLDTLRYRPWVSVEVTGSQVKFFEHPRRSGEPPLGVIAPLVPEWLLSRVRYWLLKPYFALKGIWRGKIRKSANKVAKVVPARPVQGDCLAAEADSNSATASRNSR